MDAPERPITLSDLSGVDEGVRPGCSRRSSMSQRSHLYVLADGAHARLVCRAGEPAAFVTLETMDHSVELAQVRTRLRDNPAGRTHESVGPKGYPVGRNSEIQREKAAFMREVADRAVRLAAERRATGVVIVATPRLAPILRAALGGRLKVAAEVHRDLVKVADPALQAWLSADGLLSLKSGPTQA